jgi:hypothetical protein
MGRIGRLLSAPKQPFSEIRPDEASNAMRLHTATIEVAALDIVETCSGRLAAEGREYFDPAHRLASGSAMDAASGSPWFLCGG